MDTIRFIQYNAAFNVVKVRLFFMQVYIFPLLMCIITMSDHHSCSLMHLPCYSGSKLLKGCTGVFACLDEACHVSSITGHFPFMIISRTFLFLLLFMAAVYSLVFYFPFGCIMI